MTGGNRSPYRAPCGYLADEAERYWLGSPWQHYDPDAAAIEKFQNTSIGTPTEDLPTEPVVDNVYIPYDPVEYLNLAACRKVGFKYLVARKCWQGVYGFTANADHCCIPDGDCCHYPAIISPDTTKYLTLNRTITWSWLAANFDGTTYSGGGTFAYQHSIDHDSGIETEDDCGYSGYSDATPDADVFDAGQKFNAIATIINGNSRCGTVTFDDPVWMNIFSDGYTPGAGETVSKTITDTTVTLNYRFEEVHNLGTPPTPITVFHQFTATWTLSNTYTSDDVNDDIDFLLGKWDLADDIQYPWRTDNDCTRGPLVTRFEKAAGFTLTVPDQQNTPLTSGFVDPCGSVDDSPCDGSIRGAPLPDGYDAYWDARHVNYDDLGFGCQEASAYGQISPFPHATQWTDDVDASALLPGAFAAYNTLTTNAGFCGGGVTYFGGFLIKSKYAEVILLSQPSHNFARPCGEKDSETIDQTTITTCYGADSPCNLGDLRWTGLTVPCATGAWNDNFVKGDWCLLTWTFDYRDVGENTRLRTVAEEPLYIEGSDPGTGMAVCEYDADLTQLRPTTGAWKTIDCAQHCSQFIPCCPAVVYLTPNGESSTNSQTFTIPKLTLDGLYGSKWQQAIQQWMVDPLWQRPVISEEAFNDGKAWLEDDGSGLDDTDEIAYYPQRPWEEARCSLPAGAPALAAGYLGVMSVEDINDSSTAGNIITPPAAGQCWNPWWSWAINRLNNPDGRFSCIYNDPMAVCDDDPEIEPP